MGFSRQEYCSGLPLPSPEDLPDPVVEAGSPALQADALPTELGGEPTWSDLLGKLHPCLNPALRPQLYSRAVDTAGENCARTSCCRLSTLHSSPPPRELLALPCSPTMCSLAHSHFHVPAFRPLNLHASSTMLFLSLWPCLLFHWEKETIRAKTPKCSPCTNSQHWIYTLLSAFFPVCGWETRAFVWGQPSLVH